MLSQLMCAYLRSVSLLCFALQASVPRDEIQNETDRLNSEGTTLLNFHIYTRILSVPDAIVVKPFE